MKSSHPNGTANQADLRAGAAAIEAAMREAAEEAVLLHHRLGLPLVEWHHGQIVLVPADPLLSDQSATP